MVNKPTCAELEQSVEALERTICKGNRVQEELFEQEQLLLALAQSPQSINIICLDTAYRDGACNGKGHC